MTDRPQHPSGLPIHEYRRKALPIERPVQPGPLTPRLRKPAHAPSDAIGFYHITQEDIFDD